MDKERLENGDNDVREDRKLKKKLRKRCNSMTHFNGMKECNINHKVFTQTINKSKTSCKRYFLEMVITVTFTAVFMYTL